MNEVLSVFPGYAWTNRYPLADAFLLQNGNEVNRKKTVTGKKYDIVHYQPFLSSLIHHNYKKFLRK